MAAARNMSIKITEGLKFQENFGSRHQKKAWTIHLLDDLQYQTVSAQDTEVCRQ
jgi:hypothetical protein